MRALSLSRIKFLPEVTEEIKLFLETSSYVYEEEVKAIDQLISEISAMDGNTYKVWIDELEAEKELRRIDRTKRSRQIN